MSLIANRYQILDKLGAGGMGVVYLVYDKLRGQKLALKQVLVSDTDQRLAITREFRTLSALRHPNIVAVIEYGSHENQPYFTMEYLPNAGSFDQISTEKTTAFIQILQALDYLHRRGILHRDLKPANILVSAEGLVKVLDFGLALDTQRDNESETSGTLHYMSPELFAESPASVGSDLWAVGVMLCEGLAQHHPYDTSLPLGAYITALFSTLPNLSGLDEEMESVVARLLAQEADERYRSAYEVIEDLQRAAKILVPMESSAQRESFLQAAAFVGRDKEYQTLTEALKLTSMGQNQLYLIAGEAGAGKSRLLDELRTQALVDGFAVLQGHSSETGNLPYQLWRNPVRQLLLAAGLSDLTASVLKELVPDIESLLEREVANVPALDPKSHRDRLMAAILERLRSLNSPALMILEDLHWAGDSLEILQLLLPQIENLPVMIVASFRPDEMPKLAQTFPKAQLIHLERLSSEALTALSASMIGAGNTSPQFIERLSHETEGNALFVVEVMRVLAEEAGSLHHISEQTLPAKIFAGGILAILQRRLDKVPATALEQLKLTAVLGRDLDFALLKAAGLELNEEWLQICADTRVLEPYQGEWRFTHDRLRELLLAEVPELPSLHEKAALAIEAVYPNQIAYAEVLAEHWRIAGNPEREVFYILKAARQLVDIKGDYSRAESLLLRGLELNSPDMTAELGLWLGYAAEKRGQLNDAEKHYLTALGQDLSANVKASLLNRLGNVYWRQGDFAKGKSQLEAALMIAQAEKDLSNHALSLNLLGIIIFSQGDFPTAKAYYLESLRLRRELGDKLSIARGLSNLGLLAASQGDFPTAKAYYLESLEIQRELADRHGIATTLNNLGVVMEQQGNYQEAAPYYEESITISREIGNLQGIYTSLINLGNVALYQGNFALAAIHYEEGLENAKESGDRVSIPHFLNNLGNAIFYQGDYASARPYYEEALQIQREMGEKAGTANTLESLGMLAFAETNYAAAQEVYEEALQICRELGDQRLQVYCLAGLIMVKAELGEIAAAQALLIDTLKNARDVDALPCHLLALLAAAYLHQDDKVRSSWLVPHH